MSASLTLEKFEQLGRAAPSRQTMESRCSPACSDGSRLGFLANIAVRDLVKSCYVRMSPYSFTCGGDAGCPKTLLLCSTLGTKRILPELRSVTL